MIYHDGYTIHCSNPVCEQTHESTRESRDGAIREARCAGWFVGRVRITSGLAKRKVRSAFRVFCRGCKHMVGA